MARVKRGPHRKDKRKKFLKLAKGYYGKKRNAYRVARQAVERALRFSYRDRRQKKREFRKLWIVRINAASRENGLSYNRLIGGLRKAGIDLNRKVLADIAVHDAEGFAAIVELAREGLERETPAAPRESRVKPAPKPKAAEPKKKKAEPPAKEEKAEKPKEPKKETKEKEETKPAPAKKAPKKKAAEPKKKAAEPKKKKAAEPKKKAAGPTASELEKMTVADLKKLADERGIAESDIEGSGANDNVVKADWVRVLSE